MKEFLMIVLFSKTILLTQQPINIKGNYEILLEKPISAITAGAGLKIDVSKQIRWENGEGIVEFRERLYNKFPKKTITAYLFSKENDEVKIVYSSCQFNQDEVLLSLDSVNGMPTRVDFEKVIIKSEIDLKHVSIYWQNCKK